MFTTMEVAKVLGVSQTRVRQLVLAGEMQAERRGRDWFIPASEIEKAKKRKTAPGPAKKKAGN